jgi:putative Holliday junction resolvase
MNDDRSPPRPATPPASPLRVLGVDLGMRRTGLALSDLLGISVRPLENRTPKSRAEDVAFLLALCREHEVGAVVVGLPLLPRSGDDGPMARRCRGFARALADAARAERAPLTVHLVDERGTSRAAAARLVETGVKKSARRARTDSEAAAILVETFLAGDRGIEV